MDKEWESKVEAVSLKAEAKLKSMAEFYGEK